MKLLSVNKSTGWFMQGTGGGGISRCESCLGCEVFQRGSVHGGWLVGGGGCEAFVEEKWWIACFRVEEGGGKCVWFWAAG